MATPEGVATAGGEVLVETIHARVATGDGAGGLLIEQGRRVWQVPADGSEPVLVVDADVFAGGEVLVSLMDGVHIDGSPHALYVLTVVGGESVFPDVIVHNLTTGETRAYLTDQGYEGGVGHVSYGGGVLSVGNAAEGCTWFDLVTLDQSPLPFPNPFGGGCDRPEFPQIGGGVLSPDGRTMVYLSSDDYPGQAVPADLVRFDLVAGAELGRLTLPLGSEWNRVAYDGTRVVVTSLVVAEGRRVFGESILIDAVDGTVATITELSIAGPAAFTK